MATTQPQPDAAATDLSQEQLAKSEFALGHDDPNPVSVAVIGVAGVIVVYLLILGSMGFYLFFEQLELEQKVYAAPHVEFEAYRAEQLRLLNDPASVAREIPDAEARERLAARIPIEQALDLTRRSLAAAEPANE